ncbi:hypothetical protein [Brevibacillus borstelensis]|uniref:hypothetical protein n=1 Tax=Brevibacillus borstelensis TaxID=45462 RepID=UPI0030C34EF0
MENAIQVRIYSVFSFAVRLLDAFTKAAPLKGSIQLSLEGRKERPIAKGDGWLVFTDLPAGTYRLLVSSKEYITKMASIVVATKQTDPSERLILLAPSPSYPFRSGDTLIRGVVFRPDGEPAAGAIVRARIRGEQDSAVKLAEQGEAGDVTLALYSPVGRICPGDAFQPVPAEGSSAPIIRIAEAGKGWTHRLAEPLSGPLPRSTALLPLIETSCDARGEFVLALPPSLGRANGEAEIAIYAEGAGSLCKHQIVDGAATSVGSIRLAPLQKG